jgi:hypothetical protein
MDQKGFGWSVFAIDEFDHRAKRSATNTMLLVPIFIGVASRTTAPDRGRSMSYA